jgi:hypothetical protein
MWIDAGWQQRGLDALRATLDVDSHQRKAMIQFLFDEGFWDAHTLSFAAAISRWNDCLNPGKPAFFKVAELWALMQRFGRHHLLLAMAEELGYEVRMRPTPERQKALMERMTDAMDRCRVALEASRAVLERLQDAPPAAAPVRALASVHFDLDDEAGTHGTVKGGF